MPLPATSLKPPSVNSRSVSAHSNTDSAAHAQIQSPFLLLTTGALALFLALAPSQFSSFWPGDFNFWPQALALLGLGAIAFLISLARVPRQKLDATGLLLLLFLGWNLVSVFTASYKHDAWLELARITSAVFVYFAARALLSQATWLATANALGVAVLALFALLDFATTHNPRQSGGFLNANLFASALAIALPFALIYPVENFRRTRSTGLFLATSLVFFVILLGLAVTSSKGGFLAAIVGLLVWVGALFAARPQPFKAIGRRFLPFILVGALVFGALGAVTVGPRILRAGGADNNSTQFRVYLWKGTLNMAKAHPVLGSGPGSFSTDYPRYALAGYARTAHQSWLQIAAEGGFPALLLLVGAVGCALATGKKALKTEAWPLVAAGMSGVCILIVHGFFDAPWSATSVAMQFCLALALCQLPYQPTPADQEKEEARGNLDFVWFVPLLVLVLGGYGTQIAASGSDTYAEVTNPKSTLSPPQSQQAVESALASDGGNARLWIVRGDIAENPEFYRQAVALQPNRAGNWRRLAQFYSSNQPNEAEKYYQEALTRDPLNTQILLERAKLRLDSKDSRGYDDLNKILELWNAPYGLYPALADWVNLDFARAVVLLAPELKRQKQTAKLNELVKHALADCKAAQATKKQNDEILNAAGSEFSLQANKDLDAVQSQLETLVR